MSAITWLELYRWLFIGLLCFSSTQTIVAAHNLDGHAGIHQIALGSVEIVGAILFLFRRTQVMGAGILILIFAVATILAAMMEELTGRFLFYAGTVAYILLTDRRLASKWL